MGKNGSSIACSAAPTYFREANEAKVSPLRTIDTRTNVSHDELRWPSHSRVKDKKRTCYCMQIFRRLPFLGSKIRDQMCWVPSAPMHTPAKRSTEQNGEEDKSEKKCVFSSLFPSLQTRTDPDKFAA